MHKLVERVLSLGIVYLISLGIVVTLLGSGCTLYAWSIVPTRLQRWATEIEQAGKQEELTVEEVNDWLAGLPAPSLDDGCRFQPELDPWRRPYRCVDLATKGRSGFGFYSLGSDGVSRTDGDDPDDISAWNESPLEFYWRDVRRRLLLFNLGGAALLTPVIYSLAGMTCSIIAAIFGRWAEDEVLS